jgi:hypothetical protein
MMQCWDDLHAVVENVSLKEESDALIRGCEKKGYTHHILSML